MDELTEAERELVIKLVNKIGRLLNEEKVSVWVGQSALADALAKVLIENAPPIKDFYHEEYFKMIQEWVKKGIAKKYKENNS